MLAALAALCLSAFAASPAPIEDKAAPDTRFYEVRVYYAAPGKLEALHARFRDHTLKLFEKHGMTNVGYWVPIENKDNMLWYMLSYASAEAREASWKAFMADPTWKEAFQKSEKDGKLVARMESFFMSAADYSPPVRVERAKEERVFELRTYKAAPGKLKALHERFRNHTVKLFTKHGMGHFGYWEPKAKKGEEPDTLVYLLTHKRTDAAKKSFDAFRADPDWIAARDASEKDGKLTAEVKSVMMKPTDYSPTR